MLWAAQEERASAEASDVTILIQSLESSRDVLLSCPILISRTTKFGQRSFATNYTSSNG